MEGRSLLKGGAILLALSVLRFGADHWRFQASPVVEGESDLEWLQDEARQAREERARRSKPLAPGETVDPNRSEEAELDRLPGVGPSVARAVIAERERSGGFRQPDDLLRVRGVGPAILERIRPFLDFSDGIPVDLRMSRTGGPGPGHAGTGPATVSGTNPGAASATTPGVSRPLAVGGAMGNPDSPSGRLDVNRASLEELQTLPGIGPALAGRILQSRADDGPFRSPEDLLRVRGIGPATLERIRGLILVGSG